MNATKIAQAIKAHLVALAVADQFPLDLTQLDEQALESVIEATEEGNEKAYEEAGHYLSDGDITTAEMVDAIANHEDQNDFIDNVEDVLVWEKVTYSFTCKDFLDMIGYAWIK